MAGTPVQFAKAFARFKISLAEQPPGDLPLLTALEFWPTLAAKSAAPTYQTYFDEYLSLVTPLITPENLEDFTLAELESLQSLLIEIDRDRNRAEISEKLEIITLKKAELHFYAGDITNGLAICESLPDIGAIAVAEGLISGKNEYEAFAVVHNHVRESHPALYNIMKVIREKWESVRDAYYHDRVACLFVEKDNSGTARRGRLKVLEGIVEYFGKSVPTDEVTFESQLKSPDDPFVGVVYDSLEAVRRVFLNLGFKSGSSSFYHAHFSLGSNGQAFTGDSIGLATGLIAYCQLLKPEVLRTERFISAEIACSGSVDADGRVHAVNEATLGLKIERAFFSPLRFIAVPRDNLAVSQEHLERLRQKYPRRRLHLIGIEHLRDAIDNRNIMREERVCLGEYVGRKTMRLSRSAKIQVPILLVLAYLLVCLIYPKAYIFFDWNPQYMVVNSAKSGFSILNSDSIAIWSETYNCDSLLDILHVIGNLDEDMENEVLVIPKSELGVVCDFNAMIYVYDDNGCPLWQRDCRLIWQFPPDFQESMYHQAAEVILLEVKKSPLIITHTLQNYPGRANIRIWDAYGDSLGWYINAGHGRAYRTFDYDNDSVEEILCYGMNNPMSERRAHSNALWVLPPEGAKGISPPYNIYDTSDVIIGNQLAYVIFPQSDVCGINREYCVKMDLYIESDSTLRFDIYETEDYLGHISYFLDRSLRTIECRASDHFRYEREKLVNKGLLFPVEWKSYLNDLNDSVLYWTDSGWISEADLRSGSSIH